MAQDRFVVRSEEAEEGATRFSHPWNPNSELYGTRLSSLVGLSRVGVSRVRVPPGKESFAYHSHYREEEWIYVLSGRGTAEVADEEVEVAAGDFVGFAAPQVAHHLRNPCGEDLVYLRAARSSTWTWRTSQGWASAWCAAAWRSRSTTYRRPRSSDRSTGSPAKVLRPLAYHRTGGERTSC